MGRPLKNPHSPLIRAARAQIARAEALGKSLDARMKMKREASDVWVPTEDDRRDFAAITNTLQHAGNAMDRGIEGDKKNLGGLTEAQIAAQFQAELIRAAQEMSDEDWQKMVAARAKAGKP